MKYEIQNSGLITNPHEPSEFVRVRTSSLLISPPHRSNNTNRKINNELTLNVNQVRTSSYKFVVNNVICKEVPNHGKKQ